jgi:hypothetical protein
MGMTMGNPTSVEWTSSPHRDGTQRVATVGDWRVVLYEAVWADGWEITLSCTLADAGAAARSMKLAMGVTSLEPPRIADAVPALLKVLSRVARDDPGFWEGRGDWTHRRADGSELRVEWWSWRGTHDITMSMPERQTTLMLRNCPGEIFRAVVDVLAGVAPAETTAKKKDAPA